MKNKNITIGIITVILVVGAFFVGKSYGANNATATNSLAGRYGRTGTTGIGGGFGGRAGGGTTIGQVVSMDATSITVSMPTGGSKIILYTPTTTVMKTTSGAIIDIKVGSTIIASGTANSDGSVTASSIQIRPAGSPLPQAAPMQPAQ